ncbi:hypothetical protein [Pseudomaricurvus alkylphenolicus]|nr:hypothetical protein [Pseudomaricurvus alkylphenolicus]
MLYAAFTEGWANYAANLSYEMGSGGMPLPLPEKHVEWYMSNNS